MTELIFEILKDAMLCILVAVAFDRIRKSEEWYYYVMFVGILFLA